MFEALVYALDAKVFAAFINLAGAILSQHHWSQKQASFDCFFKQLKAYPNKFAYSGSDARTVISIGGTLSTNSVYPHPINSR